MSALVIELVSDAGIFILELRHQSIDRYCR